MNDEQLLKWNHLGIIPGPGETQEAFIERARYCEKLRERFPQMIPGEMRAIEDFGSALSLSQVCFDIRPTWIPLFFSNYQLRFWQGGCAWIFQETDQAPTASFFQLRQAFRKATKYLGIYDRDEMIAHELAHAGRMMFQEPKYEELLAYQTAVSPFRRWFGSLIQTSYESMILVLLLLFACAFDVIVLFSGNPALFTMSSWFKLAPFAFLLFLLYRLYHKHKTFAQAKVNLGEVVDQENLQAVLYRLTDQEVDVFASMQAQDLMEYAQKQQELRWQLLRKAYFKLDWLPINGSDSNSFPL